jgi:hypothetical protein
MLLNVKVVPPDRVTYSVPGRKNRDFHSLTRPVFSAGDDSGLEDYYRSLFLILLVAHCRRLRANFIFSPRGAIAPRTSSNPPAISDALYCDGKSLGDFRLK